MSHHEGVSCDSCLKSDFRGKRYKCLTCLNYDLCSTCYESGVRSAHHTPDHPMQCILTRSDFDIFYGGETINIDQPYSFTCPFCGRMGFTEITLHEHTASEHSDATNEVMCPICASLPDSELNHVPVDFATHLALEHRNLREWDEPQAAMRGRRAPHPTRGMSSNRPRRSQMQFSSSSGLSSFSSANRESMDPIAELLSQLSGVRRAANLGQSHSNQLQQLQMQLQLERNSSGAPRQPTTRSTMSRRHQQPSASSSGAGAGNVGSSVGIGGVGQSQVSQSNTYKSLANGSGSQQLSSYLVSWDLPNSSSNASTAPGSITHTNITSIPSFGNNLPSAPSQNLITSCTQPILSEREQEALEIERADRSLFVQELLLNTLIDGKQDTNQDTEPSSSPASRIKYFLSLNPSE